MRRRLTPMSFVLTLALALAACNTSVPATEEAPPPPPADTPAAPATAEPTPMPEPTEPPDTGYDTYAAWAGAWTGSWTNTTFSSTGPIDATIELNPDGTGSFSFDPGGMVFGAVDPPSLSLAASFDASGITIDLPGDAVFGDVTVTINPDGTFTMVGDLIPTSGIARVEAMGTFSETSIEGTYTVFFDGSGVAEGTFSLTKSS